MSFLIKIVGMIRRYFMRSRSVPDAECAIFLESPMCTDVVFYSKALLPVNRYAG